MSIQGLVSAKRPLPTSTPSRPLRVLLVDDDQDWYAFINGLLACSDQLKCDLQWQASFSGGLRVMSRAVHDVYLVDYRLADGDGLTLLREAQQNGCRGPIILLTGKGDEAIQQEAMTAGAADYVEKHQTDLYVLTRAMADALERWRLLDALRVSEARYRALFEQSVDAVFVTSREGEIIEVNAAAVELSGGRHQDMVGHNMREMYANPAEREQVQQEIERLGAVKEHEFHFRRRDGSVRDCCLTANAHRGRNGQIVGYQEIVRDITDRHQLEEALRQAQKMDALGRLAGGVAHDFNNMLTAILGCADMLLLQAGTSESMVVDLREIQHAAERAAALTRQLLAFSRKQHLRLLPIDVNSIVVETTHLLRRTLGDEICVTLALCEDLPPIQADATQFEQVLMNLAINARDAMPRGGTLTIETSRVERATANARPAAEASSDARVQLVVRDTGHGMNADTKARLFEPFFTTKGEGRGTGLGLATAYGIVRQFGGAIAVDSEVGQGTTFTLTFPATTMHADSPVEPEPPPTTLVGTETVWLVEDDETVRAYATRVLERFGYRVQEAMSASDALSMAHDHQGPIHLLLTDVIMPGMDGRDLADWFSALHPETRVLYMTGYADKAVSSDESRQRDVLEKPFTSTNLLRKVREVLDGQ